MHFEEAETDDLKRWLVKRLEDISDADSDVLADYVLALVKSEDPEHEVQQKCREELIDFLGDNTEGFVNDVFTALQLKSYLPGYQPPPQTSSLVPSAAPYNPQFNGTARVDQSRKRSYNDREINGQDSHYGNGERTMKQPRRGVRGGRGGQQNGFGGNFQQSVPTPPPGFPQLDPTNPMSAILAMQAMGFPALPGFPSLQDLQAGGQAANGRKRCKDYDTKGYCAAGSMCPFEHGQDHIVVTSDEAGYDPKNASLSPTFPDQPTNDRSQRGFPRGRGRGGRGAANSNRGGRAPFSLAGPNHNQAITTVVVEQIPSEKFNEESVRSFFTDFGDIDEITLQEFKRLAIIKYKDYASARKAYESPKVIFDNRFVKVYWYKPDEGTPAATNGVKPKQEDTEMIDPVEFAKKQESAQQAHEEKAKKLKEAEAAREELERKIKAQAEERKRLMEKLAAKTGARAASPVVNGGAANGTPAATTKTSQNEALRAKLAELEAEAATMGLSPEEPAPAFRGRGGYVPFGRAGAFRGRGAPRGGWRGGAAGGAVARLDNRPRSVEVRAKEGGVDFGSEKVMESLRAHLFGIGEFASITPSKTEDGSNSTSAVVAFNQRYVAEIFIGSSSSIPGIGATVLSWVANPPPVASNGEAIATSKLDPGAATFGAPEEKVEAAGDADMGERDYDVADDDEDRWMR